MCYKLADWIMKKLIERFHGVEAVVEGFFTAAFRARFNSAQQIIANRRENGLGTAISIAQTASASTTFGASTAASSTTEKIPFPNNKALLTSSKFEEFLGRIMVALENTQTYGIESR